MAWQALKPTPRVENSLICKMGVGGSGRRIAGRAKPWVSLNNNLVAKLGWDEQGRYEVMIGGAESAGKVRIVVDKKGAFRPRTRSGSLTFFMDAVAGMVRGQAKGRQAAYAIVDGGIEVVIPAELMAAPAAGVADIERFVDTQARPDPRGRV